MDAEIVTLLAAIATSCAVIIIRTRDKRSSLIKAAENDDFPKFKQILDSKKAAKHINEMGANGDRVLHIASGKWKQKEIVEKIIALGGDVHTKNLWKKTPLHYAAEYNNLDAIKILLENGADMHAADIKKITPLDIAVKSKKKRTIALFDKYKT